MGRGLDFMEIKSSFIALKKWDKFSIRGHWGFGHYSGKRFIFEAKTIDKRECFIFVMYKDSYSCQVITNTLKLIK